MASKIRQLFTFEPRQKQSIDISIIDEYGPIPTPHTYRTPKYPWLNIFLFIATVLTTLFAGSLWEGGAPLTNIRDLWLGLPFSITLLVILTVHEFGHFFASRKHGVQATYPYFIPFPFSPFGTFGAFIIMRSPILSKRALLDIGAAGPIAGFIVSVPAFFLGLYTSSIALSPSGEWLMGDSLLTLAAQKIIFGEFQPAYHIVPNSVAFAAWIGLLVTAFNLMPIGQLDGGHISYALLGKKQHYLAKAFFLSLFPMAFLWPGWLFWAALIFLMRLKHPTASGESGGIDRRRLGIGIFCLIIFILCFIPVPFSQG